MDEMLQSIRDLPLASAVPVVALILAGLVLWLAGRRVLRGAFAVAGGVLGLWGGFVLTGALAVDLPAWLIAIIAGLVVAALAILVYRLALAMALVLVCGIASPLAIVTVAELQGVVETPAAEGQEDATTEEPVAGSSVRRLMQDIDEANAWLFHRDRRDREAPDSVRMDEAVETLDEEMPLWGDERVRTIDDLRQRDQRMDDSGLLEQAERLDTAQDYSERIGEAMRDWWERNHERVRPAIIAAAFIGVLTGLLLATFAPGFSATLVSAFGGSLAWLAGARILLGQMGGSMEDHLPSSAVALLGIWLLISLIGVGIQWTFRPKRADTRS